MCCLFIMACGQLLGEIVEISSIADVKNYIDKKSLIIFDIDNTLLTTAQELGSDAWVSYYRKKLEDSGCTPVQARELFLQKWYDIIGCTSVIPIEECASEFLHGLQQQSYCIMALTLRGSRFIPITLAQMASIGFDMNRSPPYFMHVQLTDVPQAMFESGILFTNGTNKGIALSAFLAQINYKPAKIVCVDDRETHLREVAAMCATENIPFIGLRYSRMDDKVQHFDPAIADIQLLYFNKILPDKAAASLK